MMRNIKLVLAYDGGNYHGFQRQNNAIAIQQIIEKNLEDGEFFRSITSEEMYEFKNIIKAQQQVIDEIKHPEREEVA